MTSLKGLFELYKMERDIVTDRALANSLGISHTALANYRAGTRRMPDMAIVKLARTTSTDLLTVLALTNLASPELSDEAKEFWINCLD